MKFFSNPWVGMIGSVASILGIPLAVYLTLSTIHAPRLTYQIHPVRTPIVTAGQSSDLHVSYKSTTITGSVSAVQIAVWNAGNQPVRPEDVLYPIEAMLGGSCKILEASIRKHSRDEAQLRINAAKFDQGILGIDWRVLEGGDGCALQIVYNGDTAAPLSVRGSVVGQHRVEELKSRLRVSNPVELGDRFTRTFGWTTIALAVLSIATGMFARRRWQRQEAQLEMSMLLERRFRHVRILLLVGVCYLAFGIFLVWQSGEVTPPFGF